MSADTYAADRGTVCPILSSLFPNCGNMLRPPDTPLPPIRRSRQQRNSARLYPMKVRPYHIRLLSTYFILDGPNGSELLKAVADSLPSG
jgi:hypothetical protein